MTDSRRLEALLETWRRRVEGMPERPWDPKRLEETRPNRVGPGSTHPRSLGFAAAVLLLLGTVFLALRRDSGEIEPPAPHASVRVVEHTLASGTRLQIYLTHPERPKER